MNHLTESLLPRRPNRGSVSTGEPALGGLMRVLGKVAISVVMGLAVLAKTGLAHAQNVDVSSAVDSIEFRSSDPPRRVQPRFQPQMDDEGLILVSGSADQPRFEFRFNTATTLATNPARQEDGSDNAAHVLPTAAISYAEAVGQLSYGLELNATSEGFAGGDGKDTSILGARANASLWKRSERLSIIATYAPKLVYSGILVDRDVTFHDLTLGVGRTFEAGALNISIDAAVNRRLAPGGFRQTQPTAIATLKRSVGSVSLSFKQQIQRRIFTGSAGTGRRDWNLQSLFEASYEVAANVVVRGGISFERNASNTLDKSFSGFDIGPKIRFGTRF